METIKGRVEGGDTFFVDGDGGEQECDLFTTSQHAGEDPERYDLSSFGDIRVIVTCEAFNGDAAWGVSDVSADLS